MKRTIAILCAVFVLVTTVTAQRITHTFQNMSMSDALKLVQRQTDKYIIVFIYDDLEDFKVTTSIHNKSVPDALRQMIGFYPISMTVNDDNEIYLECTHKTDHRLKGMVVDENNQPLPYASVTLLNPADSAMVGGGVTNESGYFVIPYEQSQVIARITYVGYKPIHRLCSRDNVGTIKMQPEANVLNGVIVKGEQHTVKAENGHLTYDMPRLLGILPADDAYEALTRIPGVADAGGGLTFTGRSVTLIINGKPTTLNEEQIIERLKQMPASHLAKAEVLPAAPAKYHVRGMAINIVTKDFTGTNQFSGQLMGGWQQNKYGLGSAGGSLIYNHGKLSIDASYKFTDGTSYGQVEHKANHPLGNQRIAYSDKTRNRSEGIDHEYHIGIDYAIADNHRFNLAYTGQWNSTRSTNITTGSAQSTQHSSQHEYLHNVDANYFAPFGLQLGISYTNYQEPRTQDLEGELYDISRHLYVDSRQKVGKWLFTVDQSHSLPKGWELSYGGKAQFANNNSYQTTLDENGQPLPDATSHVDYDERILNAYIGLSKQIGQSLSLDASVTTEQYHTTKWDEFRLYPQFNAMWNVNANNLLSLSFSSEAQYPSYWSTMSSIYYASVYSEIWGNPDLKPRSSYELNLMWQLNHKYTFLAFAEFKPDYFVQLAYQPSDRMAVIMKEDNWDYSNSGGLQVSAQYRVGNWLNGNVMGTMLYRHDKSTDFFDLPFNRTCLSAIIGSTAVIKSSSRHNLQLIFNPLFQSKTIQGTYDIDPLFRLNASLRYTSDSGVWSIIAKGDNILNALINTRSSIGNQDYAMRVWMPYTRYSLTFIYRIGNFKEKKKKEVDTSRMGY